MNSKIKSIGEALGVAYGTLEGIARSKGHRIHTLSVNTGKSNLAAGRIEGNVTVNNRSRRPFSLVVSKSGCSGSKVAITLLGVTETLAA